MKRQKLPKYIQQKFKKPQYKIGDRVKYEFLGEHGWGKVTKINKYNDKITYMVKGKGYTYPCGLQIKEYRSYYAGSIDYAETNKRNNESTGVSATKKRINNQTRERVSRSDSNTISETGSGYSSENDSRDGNDQNTSTNKDSTERIESKELNDAIDKQKDFLRRFT